MKKSKIRKIIEKYKSNEVRRNAFYTCIYSEDFDKLEKELRDLIEWNHVGNNMIQIGNKFYKLVGRKRNLQNDFKE